MSGGGQSGLTDSRVAPGWRSSKIGHWRHQASLKMSRASPFAGIERGFIIEPLFLDFSAIKFNNG